MEYRKRCNVCGHVFCFTDEDIKKNNTNTLLSGLSALGTIAGAVSGNMMAARINQADRINAEGKIIDFSHCPHCNSQDITDISDAEWEKYNKQTRNARATIQINSNASVESLIKRIYLFLEDADYSSADAYCEQALDLDPENGELYLLKQLIEFELHNVDEVIEKSLDLSSGTYYARIKKYGSADLVKQVTQIEKTVRINKYDSIVKRLNGGTNTVEQLREIVNELSQYSDIEGASEKKQECYDRITAIEQAELRRREEDEKNHQVAELEHTIKSSTEISKINQAQTELIRLLGDKEKDRIDAQCNARISEIVKQEKVKEKNTIIGVAALLVLLMILIGVNTGKSIIDKNKTENLYQEAVANIENGNYVSAINAFAKLGEYKDSSTLKSDACKNYALKLFQEQDYAQAKQMFLRVKDDSDIEQYIEYCRLYEKFQEIGEGTDLTELYASAVSLNDFNNANELIEQNEYFQDLGKIAGKWCAVDESFSSGNLFEITKEYSFIDLLWENRGSTPEYHITIKNGHIAACTKQYLYPYGEVYKYLEIIDETSVKYKIGNQGWELCKRR